MSDLDLSYPIVQRADLPPSKCCICMGDTGPFVDTRTRFPGHPADNFNVYLCKGCVQVIARHTLGMVPRGELDEALTKLKLTEEELQEADRQLAAFDILTKAER